MSVWNLKQTELNRLIQENQMLRELVSHLVFELLQARKQARRKPFAKKRR